MDIDDGRHFVNQYPDYDSSKDVSRNAGFDDSFKQRLESAGRVLIQNFEKTTLSSRHDTSDYSVYTGVSGYAFLYYSLAKKSPAGSSSRHDYISKGEHFLAKTGRGSRDTFLCGRVGPTTIRALFLNLKGGIQVCHEVIRDVVAVDHNRITDDEHLYGKSGYLTALLLLRQEVPSSFQVISDDKILKVLTAIVDAGKNGTHGRYPGLPLYYIWHHTPYVGAAHGLSGILYTLLKCRKFLQPQDVNELVRPCIDFLINARFESGNTPSSLGKDRDKLVHWCHGAPGMVYTFTEAYATFGDKKYLDAALMSGEVVWKRGLLHKGYGICHGVAGNGYALLHLFKTTRDAKWLHRAMKFAEFCMDYGSHGCPSADRPYSLFEGLAGTIYFLFDLVDPDNAGFPGYELQPLQWPQRLSLSLAFFVVKTLINALEMVMVKTRVPNDYWENKHCKHKLVSFVHFDIPVVGRS